MNQVSPKRFLDSSSDNLKSKIQNLKWVGFFAILVLLVGCVGMAEGQQAKKVPRIGYLHAAYPSTNPARIEAFRQGLRELGYVEGKNIVIEYRYAEGKLDQVPDLAAELVRLRVDVIVTAGTQTIQAVKQTTQTIPIVMAVSGDPVGTGLIASLARPGGNITGLSILVVETGGKRLELLKEAVPKASRIAVLWNSANPAKVAEFKETEMTAKALGVTLQSAEVRRSNDFDSAFSKIPKGRPDALVTFTDTLTNSHRKRIVDFAAKSRLPAIYQEEEYVDVGGLMSYGPNLPYQYYRAATYVDRILKGAKPADLPVEQPMKFALVVNLKAAEQIGLTIPPNVLVRADKVIK